MQFKIEYYHWRIHLLTVLVIAGLVFLIGRSFDLQVLKYPIYKALASNQRDFSKTIIPHRGEIFIKDRGGELYPLAINRRYWKIYAVPSEISNPQETAFKLADLLGISSEKIRARLEKKDDPYEPIKSRVSDELAEKIEALGLEGVYKTPENWRYYPEEDFASHLLGFVGFGGGGEKVGQYGIEEYYQEYLAGESGFLEAERTNSGAWISVGLKKLKPAKDGDDLVLTIDRTIQFLAAKELRGLVEKFGAQGGTIIVMDPTSGAVKAMSSFPSFNPNEYFEVKDIGEFKNPATQELFEPGSVFKPIVMAVGLDLGRITPQTIYEDKGVLHIDGYNIRNADEKIHGLKTMTQVLEESLNTGAVYVVQLLKKQEFYRYIKDFGFNIPTGIGLAGEVGGISTLDTYRDINYATVSYGQGIAVTPMELITAISAIANGGRMMKPYIVEKFIHPDRKEELVEPKELGQVISSQAAMKLTAMMVSVVKNGYGRKAGVEGYFVAGKTGTAQVPKEGKYSIDETIHSFIGFAPAFNPRFIILIKLDNPQGLRFSADSVAPTFSKMAKFLLNYYQIPPSE